MGNVWSKKTTNIDSGGDSPALWRADLLDFITSANGITTTGEANCLVKTEANGNIVANIGDIVIESASASGITGKKFSYLKPNFSGGGQTAKAFDARTVSGFGFSFGIKTTASGRYFNFIDLKATTAATTEGLKFYHETSEIANLGNTGDLTIAGTYSPFTGTHLATSTKKIQIGDAVKIVAEGFEKNNPQQPLWKAEYCNENEKGIFGIVYGIDDREAEDGKYYIACVGDMFAIVDEEAEIEYGDFLAMSGEEGKVKKYNGNDMRCVIGRAGQNWAKGENAKIAITKE